MGSSKGWIYFYLWYASILSGYVTLFCYFLPLLFISNKLYRTYTNIIFTFWQMYPTALTEFIMGCDVQISGDPIISEEISLLIMNHRTRTDWNFLWSAAFHSTQGLNKFKYPLKFVLKDAIKYIPGAGWIMQLSCFIFVKRVWNDDKKRLASALKYFSCFDSKYSLLIFPEGTDLTPSTKASCDRYAEKNNLQKYDYVLHPRTTGFAFLAKELMLKDKLDAIYDVTLVYPDAVPQTELKLFSDGFPRQVRMHFTRYPTAILPKTEYGLKSFLEKRWKDKEQVLKDFYTRGNFLHGSILRREEPLLLFFALIFWTFLPFLTGFLIYAEIISLKVVGIHTFFLLLCSYFLGDFLTFEAMLYKIKKKLGVGF